MIKKNFKITFVNISGEVKRLHKTGSAVYSHWKAEDIDEIAERASRRLQGFLKGTKCNDGKIASQG